MYIVFIVLIFIVSILLILIVLVQNSKGGGLASNFSASNQIVGVRKTADFLEKATWVLAGSLMLFSVLASMTIDKKDKTNESVIQEQIDNTVNRGGIPNLPANGESQGSGTDAPVADSLK
ncbi:MAG TPA: preprotein translocase subunit SecG [Bacteroidales bacterium]|nr:preprotein translocase subunit SecG [Bacteroidales bacterium]